ncbi:MAG TPA: hypothetical protein VF184_02560 [Phycisphaeraceae bacterium]
MKRSYAMRVIALSAAIGTNAVGHAAEAPADMGISLRWSQLPALPDREGFAGMYAGVSGGALIVAGGANFPDKRPWEGGQKHWYDTIYVLSQPDGTWQIAEAKLPRPMAYGAAVSHGDRVICIGGSDAEAHYADVFAMRWDGQSVTITALPPLPEPSAHLCAAVVGDILFVAGGASSPAATQALHIFYAMDLSAPAQQLQWQSLEPWPGPDRQQAVAAAYNGSFYLFSGIRLTANTEGKPWPVAPYLSDAYRYTPDTDGMTGTWQRIADLPRPVGAAPSPAMVIAEHGLVIFGGLDGSTLNADPRHYPPFPRDVLAYDAARDAWSLLNPMPPDTSRLTAPAVEWHGGQVIVNGEIAPGRRSPAIFWVKPTSQANGALP